MSEDEIHAESVQHSQDRASALWRRLKDHRIAQWAVGYVAVAYGIQHAVILTSESFEWPNIVARITMLALILGLPVAMTLAWYHGARARRISEGELAIVSILLVIGSFLFYVFARPGDEIARTPGITQHASVAATTPLPSGVSVAVLPFVNLSSDKEQEYFSDGITEEITAALAKVSGLRVVARTSAFEFKGKNVDIRTMGQQLGATHLIEGSVRKAGDRLRITAQLIKADDGTHVWADDYDRQLTDIFAVQEDIARTITASLQVPLGLKNGETLVSNRTGDLDAYQEYLRARALYRARSLDDAIAVLDSVVKRDPNFAPAWGLLSISYGLVPFYSPALRNDPPDTGRLAAQATLDKGERAAREALRLDPRSALGYAGLGQIEALRFHWALGEDLFKKALDIDPNDSDILHHYSLTLADAGYLKEALQLRQRLLALEPFVPVYSAITAGIMEINGKPDDAIALLEQVSPEATRSLFRNFILARAYAVRGQYEKSADTILLIKGDSISPESVADAARLIRNPKASTAPDKLPILQGELSFVYAYIGAPARMMDFPERQLVVGVGSASRDTIWTPVAAQVRRTERFKKFVREDGLVDYWKARGWPDLCHPVGIDDFACQ